MTYFLPAIAAPRRGKHNKRPCHALRLAVLKASCEASRPRRCRPHLECGLIGHLLIQYLAVAVSISSHKMASGQSAAAPWHAAYPTPRKTEPSTMSRDELLSLMKKSNGSATTDFLLIDLRRTDNEVQSHFLLSCPSTVLSQLRV